MLGTTLRSGRRHETVVAFPCHTVLSGGPVRSHSYDSIVQYSTVQYTSTNTNTNTDTNTNTITNTITNTNDIPYYTILYYAMLYYAMIYYTIL